jgi:hypothetical protein
MAAGRSDAFRLPVFLSAQFTPKMWGKLQLATGFSPFPASGL